MQQALRISRQQRHYADILWQDMLAAYGDINSPNYASQCAQRRAYQGAIVEYLLQASHSLAMAVLQKLADTKVWENTDMSLSAILSLLQQQAYLSVPAQWLREALEHGHMAQLQTAQKVFNTVAGAASSAMITPPSGQGAKIDMLASDSLADPDLWPVGQWLRAQQALHETVEVELQEY